jgi:hypothetical protein
VFTVRLRTSPLHASLSRRSSSGLSAVAPLAFSRYTLAMAILWSLANCSREARARPASYSSIDARRYARMKMVCTCIS